MASPKELLFKEDPRFWSALQAQSLEALDCATLLQLSSLRKRAIAKKVPGQTPSQKIRIALLGGYTLYPLQELVEHLFWAQGSEASLHVGEYDNYAGEILDPQSSLYHSQPAVIVLLPNTSRCVYLGKLTDSREQILESAAKTAEELIRLAKSAHERTGAAVLLANFIPPPGFDLGEMRTKSWASEWSFKKLVNMELGIRAPSSIHLCDLEFLSSRRGILASQDPKAWFETKQVGSPDFLLDIAQEIVHLTHSLYRPSKKVLVLDADNTLWGGIIGEDGLEGIALGDTSARGQAFKEFQKYILSLKQRGILLALCSKNEESVAREVFQKHPEMVIREKDLVSFKANWKPKPDNLKEIAQELRLGLDSFVFVDDSPGEIEIVRQWTPEVTTHLLSPDPANYVQELQDTRLFEIRALTPEDEMRTAQYQGMQKSQENFKGSLEDYLESLEMSADVSPFVLEDVPRIAQLINKSNQFNLTTRRRSEAEVEKILTDSQALSFTIRLKDKFVDHGLISIVIGEMQGTQVTIDTWLMSCRVLQRQVEQLALNQLVTLSLAKGAKELVGIYRPSPKNSLVRDHYQKLGFARIAETPEETRYRLNLENYAPIKTRIRTT